MKVFVTGATGFIGSAVVPELQQAGHRVAGLARSDAAATALASTGADVVRASLDELDALRQAAADADGVIHLAYNHDFSDIAGAARLDLAAMEALTQVLEGTGRPLVIPAGTAGLAPGRLATERDAPDPSSPARHRVPAIELALSFVARGVRTSVVRLAPTVHGEGDHGFIPMVIAAARRTGVSGYVGDGRNRWPAVHRLDAARLFRLALEHAQAGSILHGVGEEGVEIRSVAEAIGRGLDLPVRSITTEDAAARFGPFLAAILGADVPASSALTREMLDWKPVQPGLLADLEKGHYFRQPQPA